MRTFGLLVMALLWDSMAAVEEEDRDDEAINRALRWREIGRWVEGSETVLDIGAGTGAFSIPLAERGFRVTHFDISQEMIARARERAGALPIEFVCGDATSLGGRTADLVLCFDGAISFAGAGAERVLAAACTATRKTLIVTVSNRAAMVATWLKDAGPRHPAVREMLRTGRWDKDQFAENASLFPAPIWFPWLKAFGATELRSALERCNMRVVTVRAIGSLPHLMMPHGVSLPADDEEFVSLCEEYDLAHPDGPGSFRRAGLLAVARPIG